MNDNNITGNAVNSAIADCCGTLDITSQTEEMTIGKIYDFAARMRAMGYEIFVHSGRIFQKEVAVKIWD